MLYSIFFFSGKKLLIINQKKIVAISEYNYQIYSKYL